MRKVELWKHVVDDMNDVSERVTKAVMARDGMQDQERAFNAVMEKADLTPKQKEIVDSYLVDIVAAAEEASYSYGYADGVKFAAVCFGND